MRATQHWHLFCLGTTWWTFFFIVGLPSNYFQTMPTWLITVFGIVLPAIAFAYFVWQRCTRAKSNGDAWQRAAWIAFYMTAPLFVYDYLYLAIHQSRGWSFLVSHWYLTAFYVIPWALAPIVIVAWRFKSNEV
jgi:hypothetical protein